MAKKFVDLVVVTVWGTMSFVDIAGVPEGATVNYIYTETTPTTPQETTADLMTVNLYYIADREEVGAYTNGEWEYMAMAGVVSDVSEIENGIIDDCYAVITGTDITDLTGTKWVFNDVISMPTFNECYVDFMFINSSGVERTFNSIKLVSNSGTNYSYCALFYIGESNSQAYDFQTNGVTTNVWNSDYCKTITITGGTDATNTDLISWLETNAELVSEETESIEGTWLLNEVVDIPAQDVNLNFTTKIYIGHLELYTTATCNKLCYDDIEKSIYIYAISTDPILPQLGTPPFPVTAYIGGWAKEMNVINVLNDTTDNYSKTWLKANARKVEETPTKKFTRLYIGETVYSSNGKRFRKLQDTEPTEEEETESIIGTWVFKDIISKPTSVTNVFGDESVGVINYTYVNETELTRNLRGFDITISSDWTWYYVNTEGDGVRAVYNYSTGWQDNVFKTITIVKEPVNTDFITWLKANATKVEDSIVGTWVFNETIDLSNAFSFGFSFRGELRQIDYNGNFECDMIVVNDKGMFYRPVGASAAYQAYALTVIDLEWWRDETERRTIVIVENPPTSETFITWLKANATKIS